MKKVILGMFVAFMTACNSTSSVETVAVGDSTVVKVDSAAVDSTLVVDSLKAK